MQALVRFSLNSFHVPFARSLHEASPIMPQLIREYIAEMKLHLEYLTRQPELPLGEKLDFLRETRHCYGRTALVLSGGGALGVFHLVCVSGFRFQSVGWCHAL